MTREESQEHIAKGGLKQAAVPATLPASASTGALFGVDTLRFQLKRRAELQLEKRKLRLTTHTVCAARTPSAGAASAAAGASATPATERPALTTKAAAANNKDATAAKEPVARTVSTSSTTSAKDRDAMEATPAKPAESSTKPAEAGAPAAPPVKSLDELFHKTKAKPVIYYLPLTDEDVAQKVLHVCCPV